MRAKTHFITIKLIHLLSFLGLIVIGFFIVVVLWRLMEAPGSAPTFIDTPVNRTQYSQSI